MKLEFPELSLVVLIGVSGAGKTTFARRHFRPTEILSSDAFRGMIADDESNQAVSTDAFALLQAVAERRLAHGRLTVIDATNVKPDARRPLVALAKRHHAFAVAIVLDVPERLLEGRATGRHDRQIPAQVLAQQAKALRRSITGLRREGFRYVFSLTSPAEVDAAEVVRQPLWSDRRGEQGPFDVIGDVHGCFDELVALLVRLGYELGPDADGRPQAMARHPAGRRAIFVGDLVDRGPRAPDCLRLAMNMTAAGSAFCVPGNHEDRLKRKLRGHDVRLTHGLAETMAQLEGESAEFRTRVAGFIDGLVSHLVLDGGRLVVAHAGMKQSMQGRGSQAVRRFALYGETTGETDDFGLPVRYAWAKDYRGEALVAYGHTPVPEVEWLNNTVCLDTGCVFGGKLSALRYPERQIVQVQAAATYFAPLRPLAPQTADQTGLSAQQLADEALRLSDLSSKLRVTTRLHHALRLDEDALRAAIECVSRFGINPKWLIYLPPTMAPPATSSRAGLLEHPAEALAYYREHGVTKLVCQEKHMGSRAIAIVARDEATIRRRFGISGEGAGIIYTRSGRRFFGDRAHEDFLLASLRSALTAAGTWELLQSDWVCLDCEVMPWSAKAQPLLVEQYAATAAAGRLSLAAALDCLRPLGALPGAGELASRSTERLEHVRRFTAAYGRYCWPIATPADLRLAPFHVLASESGAHVDRPHAWHQQLIDGICTAGAPVLTPTRTLAIDLGEDDAEVQVATWWEALVGRGGEGMVVKPADFVAHGPRGLVQPAVKCRGPEYLRIIYGPEYLMPQHLERLRSRNVARKRALALREFALGVEALERFAKGEPLRRVHECILALLALESESIDPRL
jgi:protein phosphatase